MAQNPIQELSREIAEAPKITNNIFERSVIEPIVNMNQSIIKILESDNFTHDARHDIDSNSDLSVRILIMHLFLNLQGLDNILYLLTGLERIRRRIWF